jgi:hypothetical protein
MEENEKLAAVGESGRPRVPVKDESAGSNPVSGAQGRVAKRPGSRFTPDQRRFESFHVYVHLGYVPIELSDIGHRMVMDLDLFVAAQRAVLDAHEIQHALSTLITREWFDSAELPRSCVVFTHEEVPVIGPRYYRGA